MTLEPDKEKQTREAGILNNSSLNHWYKFLLYLGGAILIIGFYFYLQYPLSSLYEPYYIADRVIDFAIFTILIGASLWILDEILYYKETYPKHGVDHEKTLKRLMIVRFISWIVMFVIWIVLALLFI